jgi:hypothetical protein
MTTAPMDSKALDETPSTFADPNLIDQPNEARAVIGVSRRDITPPFGIYGPVWGFSTHDGSSRGTHKPIYATALAITAPPGGKPTVIVALDLGTSGDLTGMEDEWIRESVVKDLGIPISNLMLASSHTHGAPWPYRSRVGFPGGD